MKSFIVLLCLFPILAFSQGIADPGFIGQLKPAAAGGSLLLDSGPAAHSAFSVSRKLRTAYSGSIFKVMRSSDGTAQDIGFSSDAVDAAALESFVGAGGYGYITNLYDQTGNGRHLVNGDTNLCPLVVSNGVVMVGSNSKPHAKFDGSNDYLTTGTFTEIAQPNTIITVNRWRGGTGTRVAFDGEISTGRQALQISGDRWGIYAGSVLSYSAFTPDSTWQYWTLKYNSTSSNMRRNGSDAVTGDANTDGMDGLVLGSHHDQTLHFDLDFHEIVIWDADITTGERDAFEANVDTFYGL